MKLTVLLVLCVCTVVMAAPLEPEKQIASSKEPHADANAESGGEYQRVKRFKKGCRNKNFNLHASKSSFSVHTQASRTAPFHVGLLGPRLQHSSSHGHHSNSHLSVLSINKNKSIC